VLNLILYVAEKWRSINLHKCYSNVFHQKDVHRLQARI